MTDQLQIISSSTPRWTFDEGFELPKDGEVIITGVSIESGDIATTDDITITTDATADAVLTIDTSDAVNLTIDSGITWKTATNETEYFVNIDGKLILQGKELTKEYFETIEYRLNKLENGGNEMNLLTTTNVLIVMAICVVTVKFVLPRVTLRNAVRAVVRLVYKPGKKAVEEIEKEWDEANQE